MLNRIVLFCICVCLGWQIIRKFALANLYGKIRVVAHVAQVIF